MCGILGYSGNFNTDLLKIGLDSIAHRGPDDSDTFVDEQAGIGLGHVRLSILDLSPLGRQPMTDEFNRVFIVFNGEIYNYRELSNNLEKSGFRFRGHSDTEVLLSLYLADGPAMLSKLNGIYSFAIWDTRNQSLFVARDGFGIKPLYYAETAKGFLFSSELKALLHEPGISRELNPAAIVHHLTYLWCPSPHTMLSGIAKLEPGHAMLVRDGKIVKKWQFYDLPNAKVPYWQGDEAAAIHAVQQSVEQAVKRQMIADVPVGAFLSGGLDSSAVVAFAKQYTDQRFQCFTIALEGAAASEGMIDDLPYAKRVAKHLDVDLHTIRVGSEMADQIETMIWHLDEPQADPAPINTLFISQLARQHGIKVLLSGAGGDDIFTGYRRHFALQKEIYWAWLPRLLRLGLSTFSQCLPNIYPVARRIRKAFAYADWDHTARLASYFFWYNPLKVINLLHPDLRASVNVDLVIDPLVNSLKRMPANASQLDKMLYLEGKYFLTDHNLNYTDKMSMAEGVEVRVPLLDAELVNLAASLPDHYKQRGTMGKWIFKKAMEPYLPHDVIYRPKTGFGAPLRHWLKHELKELVDDTLSYETLTRRGLFDPLAVNKLIQQDRSGKIDTSYTIFSLICIETWCRLFLDRKFS